MCHNSIPASSWPVGGDLGQWAKAALAEMRWGCNTSKQFLAQLRDPCLQPRHFLGILEAFSCMTEGLQRPGRWKCPHQTVGWECRPSWWDKIESGGLCPLTETAARSQDLRWGNASSSWVTAHTYSVTCCPTLDFHFTVSIFSTSFVSRKQMEVK